MPVDEERNSVKHSNRGELIGGLTGLGVGALAWYLAAYNNEGRETIVRMALNAPEYLRGFPALAGLFILVGGTIPLGYFIGYAIGRRLSKGKDENHQKEPVFWKTLKPYDFKRG